MPEDTFRPLKRLHLVFAASSLALLATTLWLIVADHRREWKVYQRAFRDRVEPWAAEARQAAGNRQQAAGSGQRAGGDGEGDNMRPSPPIPRPPSPASRPAGFGRSLLRLPILDAFGRTLSIDQIWLPELSLDYHFRPVPRIDRCTTCHQAIDKAPFGPSAEPGFPRERLISVRMPAGGGQQAAGSGQTDEEIVASLYGLCFAPTGILDPQRPTIQQVYPRSPAAEAELSPGDAIDQLDHTPVAGRADAVRRLAHPAAGQRTLELTVRRGLPHPYSAHPRLDLFAGPHSPHPAATFGCTVCHEGQGSATAFGWASHTPNTPDDRARWRRRYGWFANADWEYPMRPARFIESSCLRCHHEPGELEPGPRFRDPPAPKLLAGYHLVRQLGCFGCHEIRGVDESRARTGPDMRLEPNYHEAALELRVEPRLTPQERAMAEYVIAHPEEPGPRRQLAPALAHPSSFRIQHSLQVLGTETPVPGTLRKVGPPLRHLADKLDAAFVEGFLAKPADFHPDTRMPALFGHYEHLEGKTLDDTRRLEAAEIRAATEWLFIRSQPLPAPPRAAGAGARPSVERGKRWFAVAGCLACHKHAGFPEVQATIGPDLSRLPVKLTTKAGKNWLADWLRDPVRYSPRTTMPCVPMEGPGGGVQGSGFGVQGSGRGVQGSGRGEAGMGPASQADPAADIAAYLLHPAGTGGASGTHATGTGRAIGTPSDAAEIDELALDHLSRSFPLETARQYLRQGIPQSMAAEVDDDARELLGPPTPAKKLRYVGRHTIRKRGCFGCHDIPEFADARPIGPPLSDWGRKPTSQLEDSGFRHPEGTRGSGTGSPNPEPRTLNPDREGFLLQKLHAPRSFDYRRADHKGFNEQLLMGRFSLTDEQIEAIATFVLGLVDQPPAARYVSDPPPQAKAVIAGRKVLDTYACSRCHTLGMERWTIRFRPERFPPPRPAEDYEFVRPQVGPQEVSASLAVDRRGLGRAELVGLPRLDGHGRLVEEEDDDGNGLHFFDLWEPAVINGKVWPAGGAQVPVSKTQLAGIRPAWGGEFARWLYPIALAEAKAGGQSASEVEAWGWMPPALVGEGNKVQPAWLHEYLLAPAAIRPAAVLRMPRFHLSPQEAAALVGYFAASAEGSGFEVQGSEFGHPEGARGSGSGDLNLESPRREGAMRLVTDRQTFCAKCHQIGDYSPGGQVLSTVAPNLESVGQRIRPEYLRRWLANPKSVLPYTAMPVNFPPAGAPRGQDLYRAASIEQLDAVVDLLLDYQRYTSRRTSIRKWIERAADHKP
jgi:cbb3-type cytochrome oxidase cytochrome c subunit